MGWTIEFHHDLARDFKECDDTTGLETLAIVDMLREEGPALGRLHVDTLQGSRQGSMKELRCRGAFKTWRVALVFTPERTAMPFVAGDKSRMKSKRFCRRLIVTAEKRSDRFPKEATEKEPVSCESA